MMMRDRLPVRVSSFVLYRLAGTYGAAPSASLLVNKRSLAWTKRLVSKPSIFGEKEVIY